MPEPQHDKAQTVDNGNVKPDQRRFEMQPAGVRVVNVFPGPIDDEWNQTLPAPKLKPDALARSITKALQEGVEDIYPGDVAQEWLARWRDNPKILERELAAGARHG